MATRFLFTYGSLLTGPADARVRRALRACRVVGSAWIRGRLYDLGPYPGVKPSPRRNDRVWGTLYRLRDPRRTLRRLDVFEDYRPGQLAGSEYLRRRTTARCSPHGRALVCWVYFYNRTVRPRARIPDGDYRSHLGHAPPRAGRPPHRSGHPGHATKMR